MRYRAHIIESTEGFQTLEPAWNDLLAESPADNYFLRWEWLWNWWDVFGRTDDKLRIIVVENGDGIVAIAPLYTRKRALMRVCPVRRMMFLGTQDEGEGDVCSDYMSIIYKKGEEKDVVDAVFKTIEEEDLCDEVYFPRIDRSSRIIPFIQERDGFMARILNEYESPYVTLPATWDGYLASLSSSMRSKIRRERKRLEALPSAGFVKTETHDELRVGFDELVRLHQINWESRGFPGSFSSKQFMRFHETMMPKMMENGHLELVLLSIGASVKAVIYNIVYHGTTYFYQSGVDRADKGIAFGYLAHSHCIKEAIEAGMSTYDFLPKGGTDDYKDRFANGARQVFDLYLVRRGFVKFFVKAQDFARGIYHRVR